METKPKIIVIVGPTASGKTGLSIKIAKEFDGEVISADSRQVYKGLDIGTEKVTEKETENIPHHLLDVATPETVYSAADFKIDAITAIREVIGRNHLPIIAGGTFFYIDMLLGRISSPEVAPNPALRAELEHMKTDELFAKLQKLDPNRAATVDSKNYRRLIRAIEIATEIGHVPKLDAVDCPYEVLMIGIEVDRIELRDRLRARAEEALTKGLIEETKQLLDSGVTRDRLSEIGHEYKIVLEYLDGNLTDEQLIQKLEEKNWQYAKRQLMWLKRDDSIEWFTRESTEAIFARVQEFLG